MNPAVKNAIKIGISLAVVLGFVVCWLWLSLKVWTFDPTDTKPKFEVSDAFASLAGLLSTTVATATAVVLGFEIKGNLQVQESRSWWEVVKTLLRSAFTKSGLLTVGCVSYAVVGAIVLLVYVTHADQAPETMSAFYLAAVGWALGAFSSTFRND